MDLPGIPTDPIGIEALRKPRPIPRDLSDQRGLCVIGCSVGAVFFFQSDSGIYTGVFVPTGGAVLFRPHARITCGPGRWPESQDQLPARCPDNWPLPGPHFLPHGRLAASDTRGAFNPETLRQCRSTLPSVGGLNGAAPSPGLFFIIGQNRVETPLRDRQPYGRTLVHGQYRDRIQTCQYFLNGNLLPG